MGSHRAVHASQANFKRPFNIPLGQTVQKPIAAAVSSLALALASGAAYSDDGAVYQPTATQGSFEASPGSLPTTALAKNPTPPESLHSQPIAASLDWRPLALVPQPQQDRRCRQCEGAFVDPLADAPATDPFTTDVEIDAATSNVTETELIFEGDVTVKQGSRSMRADRVAFDRATQIGEASGHITLREPGVVMIGDTAFYDQRNERADIHNARFALHNQHLSGAAGQLTREASGHIAVQEGTVTFCAPDDPNWMLKAAEIQLEPDEGIGTAYGATLEVADVPVFYMPWVQFPIDDRRKTGLLFPDIGTDTRGGVDITAPIYLNLAPNYDATYAPRLIAERGVIHQLSGRWLSENTGYWQVASEYISQDDKYKDEHPELKAERWLLGVQQQGYFSQKWRTTIDYGKVSDPEYIRDLNNSTLSAQRQTALLQLGQVDYLGDDWTVNIQAQQFQSLADDIRNDYKKLPQITAAWRGEANWGGVQPIALAQYSNFDTDGNKVTGQRMYAEAGLTYPMSWVYGFLRPTVKYRQVNYELDEFRRYPDTSPSAGSAVASVDGGLFFERQVNFGGESMTQTLEPRVFYVYSEYDEQTDQPDFDSAELTFSYNQLFRDTRFSGHDRLDDANQVALGLTTRFFADSDGRERISASIGQIFYFRDRRVRLNAIDPALNEDTSATAAEFNWSPTSEWSVRSSLLYNGNESQFDAASAQVSYVPGNGSVFNVGYTLREPPPSLLDRPVTEQANVSAYYPIDDHWSIFGALEYSLEASQAVEDMVGFEYDDCCWQFRLLYMRYIDTAGNIPDLSDPNLNRENALQFQFVLKGMGGFGGRVEGLLKDMIRGFDTRF